MVLPLCKKNQLPDYFSKYEIKSQYEIHNHNTRKKSLITQPLTRIQAARRCLRNHISVVINSTPKVVIDKVHTHSYKGFALYTKKSILSSYSVDCLIENCYICNL